jgi:hypothetical protein
MTYGTIIPGLTIDGKPAPYGVVNERAIRAAAGIMFALGFFTLLTFFHTRNTELAFWFVLVFFADFVLKVVFGPERSPFNRIGAFLVRNQRPEYVGAIQKRFAWTIGLVLSGIVLAILSYQMFLATSCTLIAPSLALTCALPMALCSLCLIFLWLESAIGYCVGCGIYSALVKRGIIKRGPYAPACPGGVCAV